MSVEITMALEDGYVLIHVTGVDSYEASLDGFGKLAAFCREHRCFRVLGVSHLTALETMEAYDHVQIFRRVGITPAYRIAWIEMNERAREVDEFIETVLSNRGYHQMKMFREIEVARAWLLEGEKPSKDDAAAK